MEKSISLNQKEALPESVRIDIVLCSPDNGLEITVRGRVWPDGKTKTWEEFARAVILDETGIVACVDRVEVIDEVMTYYLRPCYESGRRYVTLESSAI